MSSAAVLANPHRIKRNRRVRSRSSIRRGHYYRARYYSPSLKRFIGEDPIGFGGGQNSFYAFVGGDPVDNYDPYGLMEWPPDIFSQNFVDAAAGLGDALSFGLTAWARNKLDIGGVDECSGFYQGGMAAAIIAGLADGEGEAEIADIIAVDSRGNAIPLREGEYLTGSQDGRWIQVRDADGNPTGMRIDGPHSPATHNDPRALQPHAHRPGIVNGDGTPWLPIN